jgi:hypothetical protein
MKRTVVMVLVDIQNTAIKRNALYTPKQNKKYFLTDNESHNIDTRQRNDVHLPQANLTIYQRGAQYLGIKIFNNLPLEIRIVADKQKSLSLN